MSLKDKFAESYARSKTMSGPEKKANEIMVISQFTLHANTRKGNRPSYIKAAKPEIAIPIYEKFCKQLQLQSGIDIKTGAFGADMKVSLINDGPVTIWIDSKDK